mmetsp:Transcript_2659/g.8051  ORF Transcript_2659/g.8051 Transcript_2659/m.8051 type:complete len:232 (+) Transcript_2659:963-1658(+)
MTAWWTCPSDAAANGRSLNCSKRSRQFRPSSAAITSLSCWAGMISALCRTRSRAALSCGGRTLSSWIESICPSLRAAPRMRQRVPAMRSEFASERITSRAERRRWVAVGSSSLALLRGPALPPLKTDPIDPNARPRPSWPNPTTRPRREEGTRRSWPASSVATFSPSWTRPARGSRVGAAASGVERGLLDAALACAVLATAPASGAGSRFESCGLAAGGTTGPSRARSRSS